ncbi:P-loop containing nucleoside triphosphate hydrolase protein [Trametes sanguinea]|nr:P-loop containing nucleoside triphosphate hydrolase protein [Trametes sanguinea]
MASGADTSPGSRHPTLDEVRQKTIDSFGRRPCLWQCESALAQLRGGRDIVCISGTGSGKTLTFWMPLLFNEQGIQVVITPLNVLGNQNKRQLAGLGIQAIALSGETATAANFQAIANLQYRVIVVNPEIAFKVNGGFSQLWRNAAFVSRVIAVIWDEAHCVSTWSSFRPDYGDAGRLRSSLAPRIPYLLPSATFPPHISADVFEKLQVRRDRIHTIHRSNDRPDVYLTVRKIQHSLNSFKDLEALVPDRSPGARIPRFLAFFDNKEESVKAATVLQALLPAEEQHKVVWFNSDCTPEFREYATEGFQDKKLYGLYCTDSFGMGVDIPDVEVVVQWRVTCDLDTLWQRFGRAARGQGREGVAILYAEAKYFDEERQEAAKRAEKRRKKAQQKSAEKEVNKRKRPIEDEGDQPARRPEPPSVEVAVTEPQLTVFEQLRVSYALTRPVRQGADKARGKPKAGKGTNDTDLSNEIDNLVNAATRAFKCYRVPVTAYYGNDRLISDDHACLPGGDGCARCHLSPSAICCSLCSPDHALFSLCPAVPPAEKSAAGRASQVDSRYKMTDIDIAFRRALHAFRRQQTEQAFGKAHLRNLGTGAIMGDDTLDRIADCAHAGKLGSLEALARETKWSRSNELGDAVLELIKTCVRSFSSLICSDFF